jgi:aminopeptidase
MLAILRDIFRTNLGVKKNERCLVFTDKPSVEEEREPAESERRSRLGCIAFLAAETGKCFVKEMILYEFPSTKSHGVEPPPELWEKAFGKKAVAALRRKKILEDILAKKAGERDVAAAEAIISRFRGDAVDAVVALSYYSTSHTRFRDFLTRICGARYASMPLFDVSMLEGPMSVDWKSLAQTAKRIAAAVNKAEAIEISTPNGTHLSFSTRGRKALADTGILTRPGSFGNLPAGEVFLAPVEGSANGRLVVEWAPTRELKSPVALTVEDGFVRKVTGEEDFAGLLSRKLEEREENRNIAEFGIGTNNMAKRPDNILESEKILGTIHIALGDNSNFGGNTKTPFHQDFVFFRPTVTLALKDGKKAVLMKNGKFRDQP